MNTSQFSEAIPGGLGSNNFSNGGFLSVESTNAAERFRAGEKS